MSENENIKLKLQKPSTPKVPVELPPSSDDTGSQALSEALRSSFVIVKFAMIILVIAFLCSGFFTVGPQQQAIKLRFGKPVGEGTNALLGPGFHWALPRPIDEVTNISIGQIQRAQSTVGWYAIGKDGVASPVSSSINPAIDSYTLTSDTNIIHVSASLQYRITDPISYLFDYVNAAEFITNALNNSILYASAHFKADEALTDKQTEFRRCLTAHLEKLIHSQKLGILVEQVDVTPAFPRNLEGAFKAVIQATISQQNTNTQALSYTNTILSKARAQAQGLTNAAQRDAIEMIAKVRAEETNFICQLPQYETNSALFTQIRQLEVLNLVLSNAQERIFLPARHDGKTRELRLLLNREPKTENNTSDDKDNKSGAPQS